MSNITPQAKGVAKRLTPRLADKGFTAVPTTFLTRYHEMDVTSAQAMIIVHLLSYKWGKSNPYPRLKTLAERMGLSENAVRSHLKQLEDKHLIKRVARPGHSNVFDMEPLFLKLEALLEEEEAKGKTTPTNII